MQLITGDRGMSETEGSLQIFEPYSLQSGRVQIVIHNEQKLFIFGFWILLKVVAIYCAIAHNLEAYLLFIAMTHKYGIWERYRKIDGGWHV